MSSLLFLLCIAAIIVTTTSAVDVLFVVDCRLHNISDNGMIYISRIGHNSALNFQALPLANVRHPIAVDFEPTEGKVYWTDYTDNSISRAYPNGSYQQVLVGGLGSPSGLALDSGSQTLYWTDEERRNIGRANLDGTNQTIIVDNLDQTPRPIIVNSGSRHIYWAEWHDEGTGSKIVRAAADGSNVHVLVNTGLKSPNGLTINGDYLYWCDAGTDMVEQLSLSGQIREIILQLRPQSMPFDLAFYKHYLYYTDWITPLITRVHVAYKEMAVGGPVGPRLLHMGTGIHIQKDFTGSCFLSPCLNGATCLDIDGGFTCLCLPGYHGNICQEVNTGFDKETTAKANTRNELRHASVQSNDEPGYAERRIMDETHTKFHQEYAVTSGPSMSSTPATNASLYDFTGKDDILANHAIIITAVGIILSLVILIGLVMAYHKIGSCHMRLDQVYETTLQKYVGTSIKIYEIIPEDKPKGEYETFINSTKPTTGTCVDNPGYTNAHGMSGLLPSYVNLSAPPSESPETMLEPPTPPSTQKLIELTGTQQTD